MIRFCNSCQHIRLAKRFKDGAKEHEICSECRAIENLENRHPKTRIKCQACKTAKPAADFWVNYRGWHYSTTCVACRKARRRDDLQGAAVIVMLIILDGLFH